jgi:hypothetical protein
MVVFKVKVLKPKIQKQTVMDSAKNQLAEKLKTANNILVTVSRNPSVDQLSACLGLTLLLNKAGKHSAAVFSGEVPSTLEFLQPEETLEKNTDSLRDFIIALDKSKADKLRYKVEDNVVRIFITPYKTSISQEDLEFSEGDFNVDVVVAIGVHQQDELDEAITAHGRILHDATVSSINTSVDGGLGSINWHDDKASSLSELVTELAQAMDGNLFDQQIATALLTGIVAETDRFSNEKTSSQTMSASAILMNAGANQQLVVSKLEAPAVEVQHDDNLQDQQSDDGMLEIEHVDDVEQPKNDIPSEDQFQSEPEQPTSEPAPEAAQPDNQFEHKPVTEPPSLGGTLTANSRPEGLDPSTDPFSMPANENPQLLDHSASTPSDNQSRGISPAPVGWTPPTPEPVSQPPTPEPESSPKNPTSDSTLVQLEAEVHSPHLNNEPLAALDTVREKVDEALAQNSSGPQTPIEALNAQPLGENLHPQDQAQPEQVSPADMQPPQVIDPNAPPPVPPPIPFQFGTPPNNDQQNQQ